MVYAEMDIEEKKILCETIRKIVYGIEFDELPPAKILRYIEEEHEVVLEFKNHFRYLVPQVYGWEFMDEYMYEGRPFPHKKDKLPEREERIKARLDLRPDINGISYFEFCRCVTDSLCYLQHRKKFDEEIRFNERNTEKAAALCESLFYSYYWMIDEIDEEEKYLQKQSTEYAILDKLYSQLRKYLGDNVENKLRYDPPSKEFVEIVIENKLLKCEDTLSGDSGLKNFWEEYCVQVQQEHSFYWETYVDQLHLWVEEEFKKLPMWQRNAIWLDLKNEDITDYFDKEYDPDESKDEAPLFYEDDVNNVDIDNKEYYDLNEVIDRVTDKITDEAADFTN